MVSQTNVSHTHTHKHTALWRESWRCCLPQSVLLCSLAPERGLMEGIRAEYQERLLHVSEALHSVVVWRGLLGWVFASCDDVPFPLW